MIFIETKIFTKKLDEYLTDDEYSDLQAYMIENPEAGDLIPATGGLRKLRWAIANKGKRGGIRVIYYWKTAEHHIYLMTLYAKNEITDLSAEEKKILKQMVERWSQ